MYRIGVFSKISNTPVQTLRYYDSLKLLIPSTIGKYNSYRYYTNEQLSNLNIIKKLKKMGFKLKEISKVMNKYDEEIFSYHKKRLQSEANERISNIRELEDIIRKMKYNSQLTDLMTKKEGRQTMKEKYNEAKEGILKCYDMYKKGDQDNCLISLEELKNKIFSSEGEEDPFWTNAAGDLFTGVLFELMKNNTREEINFLNVFQFRVKGKEYIDDITNYVDTLSNDSYSYICLASVSKAPKDTRDSIVYVFKSRMKPYAMFDSKN